MPDLPPANHQTVRLSKGKHSSPQDGVCVMELSSMLAGEPFTDQPRSVCRVIAAFLRAYNDGSPDDARQTLYHAAAKVVGTRAPLDVERERARRCAELTAELHIEQSRLRRWLRPQPPASMHGEALEGAGVQLARMLLRRGARPERVLGIVDQLVALGGPREELTPAAFTAPWRPVALER